MGNAQEAIEDYEKKNANVRKMDAKEIVTLNERKHDPMILDFKHEDRACCYLAQQTDGTQKWIRDPHMIIWGPLIDAYWSSPRSNSNNDEP